MMDLNEAWLVLREAAVGGMVQLSPEESDRYMRAAQAWRGYTRGAIRASGRGADPALHVIDTLAEEGRLAELCEATVRRLEQGEGDRG